MWKLELKDRCFRTRTLRPRPECYVSEDKKLLVVLTPWGADSSVDSKELFEELKTQYNALSSDREKTHPFPKLISLTPNENNMRCALHLLNQQVFNSANEEEWLRGFEVFFVTVQDQVCSVVQVGQPMAFLHRGLREWHGVGNTADFFAFHYSAWQAGGEPAAAAGPLPPAPGEGKTNPPLPPPLPGQLLGIHQDISVHPVSFRIQKQDRLILLSRHHVPVGWFQLQGEQTLQTLSEMAAREDSRIPFWMACMSFS